MIVANKIGPQNVYIYAAALPPSFEGTRTASLTAANLGLGGNTFARAVFAVDVTRSGDVYLLAFATVPQSAPSDYANGIVPVRPLTYYDFAVFSCEGYAPSAKEPLYVESIFFSK